MTITDIINRTYFLSSTNSSNYPQTNMLLSINAAYNRVASLVMKSDGRWQWDDNNNTDLPIATTNIVQGQRDYSLSVTHLKIIGIESQDSSGIWRVLEPHDREDDGFIPFSYKDTIQGIPIEYDLLGDSVFLWPVPNYSQTNGLKIFFERGPAEFTAADISTGTKAPGFNSLYHDLIPLWAAYDYAVANGLGTVNTLFGEIQRKEDQLVKDYAIRDRNEHQRLKTRWNPFK